MHDIIKKHNKPKKHITDHKKPEIKKRRQKKEDLQHQKSIKKAATP